MIGTNCFSTTVLTVFCTCLRPTHPVLTVMVSDTKYMTHPPWQDTYVLLKAYTTFNSTHLWGLGRVIRKHYKRPEQPHQCGGYSSLPRFPCDRTNICQRVLLYQNCQKLSLECFSVKSLASTPGWHIIPPIFWTGSL